LVRRTSFARGLLRKREIPFFPPELAYDVADHFSVLQADGKEKGFQRLGAGHVNRGGGMEFGAVEQAIKSLLVFPAQPLAKLLPPPVFLLQHMAGRPNGSARIFPPMAGSQKTASSRLRREGFFRNHQFDKSLQVY
jgi:hypothetical protein